MLSILANGQPRFLLWSFNNQNIWPPSPCPQGISQNIWAKHTFLLLLLLIWIFAEGRSSWTPLFASFHLFSSPKATNGNLIIPGPSEPHVLAIQQKALGLPQARSPGGGIACAGWPHFGKAPRLIFYVPEPKYNLWMFLIFDPPGKPSETMPPSGKLCIRCHSDGQFIT